MLSFTLLDSQPWKGEGSVKLLREARMEQKEESIEEERWWMSLREKEKEPKINSYEYFEQIRKIGGGPLDIFLR